MSFIIIGVCGRMSRYNYASSGWTYMKRAFGRRGTSRGIQRWVYRFNPMTHTKVMDGRNWAITSLYKCPQSSRMSPKNRVRVPVWCRISRRIVWDHSHCDSITPKKVTAEWRRCGYYSLVLNRTGHSRKSAVVTRLLFSAWFTQNGSGPKPFLLKFCINLVP